VTGIDLLTNWRTTMKRLLACIVFLLGVGAAEATTYQLETPYIVGLSPVVYLPRCAASTARTAQTAVTGLSSEGNSVLGQALSTWVCGSSGRGGGGLHYYTACTTLQWDLTGALISVTTPVEFSGGYPVSTSCPSVTFNATPSTTPPSSSVVGNEFTNAEGYVAKTVIEEICGSVACYATYWIPTLVTP
jgi:hypothetical protein